MVHISNVLGFEVISQTFREISRLEIKLLENL